MFSVYIELLSAVAGDVKKDRKAHLAIRWINSLNTYLDGSSDNVKVCSPVKIDFSDGFSSGTIRAVTGTLLPWCTSSRRRSRIVCLNRSVPTEHITPVDVCLNRISGAALYQMIQLRKDTLSKKKGKRKITSRSRSQMEMELNLLENLKETDKSHFPKGLKLLDERNLTFVNLKKDFLKCVREADLSFP